MSYIREKRMSRGLKQALDSEEDVQDRFLAAEEEEFDNFSENLTLKIENQEVLNQKGKNNSSVVPIKEDNPGSIVFEVVNAEKVKEGRSTFVKYTLSVGSEGGTECRSGIIGKRYSDFSVLNSKLRRKFPKEMEDISFPGKLMLGNFSSETIAQRSRAFEQYLTHLFTIDCVRFSDEFKDFLYQRQIQEGIDCAESGNFSQCVDILEGHLPVQRGLQGDQHADVVCTLCMLSACHQKLGNREAALRYAESALSCMDNNTNSAFLVPLLHHTIYLCWLLNHEKSHLESRLASLGDKGGKSQELLSVILSYNKAE